jgi:hypothetical protein
VAIAVSTAINRIKKITVDLVPSIAADEIIQGRIHHPWCYANKKTAGEF